MKSVTFVRVPSVSENVNKKSPHEILAEGIQELFAEHYREAIKQSVRQYWKNKGRKAVGYVRVSSTMQRQNGHSTEAQKKLLQEFAKEKGFEIVDFFEDCGSAISKLAGRRKMYTYLKKNGEITHVLSAKQDRLSRTQNHNL